MDPYPQNPLPTNCFFQVIKQIICTFQSVSDIFHELLTEIEKADGNLNEKSNCVIC